MKLNIIWPQYHIMYIIGICSPCKIMHHRCNKTPSKCFCSCFFILFCISMSNFFRVLKISCTTDYIVAINSDGNIKITPHAMKLSSDIRVGMPTVFIVFNHFRVPLCHRKINPFFIVSSTSTNLYRYLSLKHHVKHSGITW